MCPCISLSPCSPSWVVCPDVETKHETRYIAAQPTGARVAQSLDIITLRTWFTVAPKLVYASVQGLDWGRVAMRRSSNLDSKNFLRGRKVICGSLWGEHVQGLIRRGWTASRWNISLVFISIQMQLRSNTRLYRSEKQTGRWHTESPSWWRVFREVHCLFVTVRSLMCNSTLPGNSRQQLVVVMATQVLRRHGSYLYVNTGARRLNGHISQLH
jgi:hypothetical protein